MFFPNAKNTLLQLLKIENVIDKYGIKKTKINSEKRVYGIIKSVTTKEYLSNVELNKNVEFKVLVQVVSYDDSKLVLIKDKIYKVERTYINGNFIELYLSLSNYKLEDLM